MCGIVGLFLKNKALAPQLGSFTARMLEVMSDRGPDSAGFAVYGAGSAEIVKLTLRVEGESAALLAKAFTTRFGVPADLVRRSSHAVLAVPKVLEAEVRLWLAAENTGIHLVGAGTRMELYKEVGLPSSVADRFGLPLMSGTHAIGHTRMATESSVTTDGAHPFSTGMDQCLVHNGSLSNHNAMRRVLIREGLSFETENDSEVAAAYLTWRMREGASLSQALTDGLDDLDGFYTFVVGTEGGFAVLRDPIACKPAVMAETGDYVAFGSEYRALAMLPNIEKARLFEPEPAKVYVWEH
ncbi:MAG TPA: glutamine amidotransferase family protein [Rhizomicrobium sp.]|nr:glutamine amidotransferase family protein [Rhizomicrobium sp.]